MKKPKTYTLGATYLIPNGGQKPAELETLAIARYRQVQPQVQTDIFASQRGNIYQPNSAQKRTFAIMEVFVSD
jgi:hypothetical protein